MFRQKKILAVIPARGGSKGVPRKNIRPAGGKPLIAWMIAAAKGSGYIDRLILSSDDTEIIETAKKFNCDVPFIRPAELARDDSSASDVILHALENIPGFDYVMLLQPTSPLTQSCDIDSCIASCISSQAPAAVSVTTPGKNPYWMFRMEKGDTLVPLHGKSYLQQPRQKLPSVVVPTGAVYIAEAQWFLMHRSFYSDATKGVVIPEERSIDIDTELDLKLFELILAAKPSA